MSQRMVDRQNITAFHNIIESVRTLESAWRTDDGAAMSRDVNVRIETLNNQESFLLIFLFLFSGCE